MRAGSEPTCFISGGEPVVKLVESSRRGLGGRNQQFGVGRSAAGSSTTAQEGICVLSGGTDGEDGPTDAAGAFLDADIFGRRPSKHLDPAGFYLPERRIRFF